MYNEYLYHGTNRERGTRIIANNKMEFSTGDKHWLGDGCYLFEEEFFSYKWILDMFYERYFRLNVEKCLNEYYEIIKVHVIVEKDRVLDLAKSRYKILFDTTFKEMKNMQEFSERFSNEEIAEGVVINYMFKILGFDKDYDVVRALFTLNRSKYNEISTRIGYMPQAQVSVKNLSVIESIEEYDYTSNIQEYEYLIHNMYFYSDNGKYEASSQSYYSPKRNIYKKSKKHISIN